MATKVRINPPAHGGKGAHVAAAAENHSAQAPAEPDNIVVDARGRRLVIAEPDFLTESRIMRAIGDASTNQGYVMGYVMPAAMVVQIDEAKLPYPTTNQEIEAAIGRLGHDGLMAVMGYIAAKNQRAMAMLQAAKQGELSAEAQALKNS